MKERKDLIKAKSKAKAGLVAVGASTYQYTFPANGEPVEVLRAHFEGRAFAAVRDRLEVVEDPVLVRDENVGRPAERATRRK